MAENWQLMNAAPERVRIIVCCEADTMGRWVEVLNKSIKGEWFDDSGTRVGKEVNFLAWMPLPTGDLSKENAIRRLKELQACGDQENGHIEADGILCELLVSLGYEDVVNEYDKIGKWYA